MGEVEIKVGSEDKPKEKFEKWEIEDAVRTIIRAEEIKQDKKLMEFVAPKLAKQKQAVDNAASVLYGNSNKEG